MLERYAQAQFDLAISKGQGSSDLAEIAVGKIAIGLAEMRRVGGVVSLQAKFGFDFLGDCDPAPTGWANFCPAYGAGLDETPAFTEWQSRSFSADHREAMNRRLPARESRDGNGADSACFPFPLP